MIKIDLKRLIRDISRVTNFFGFGYMRGMGEWGWFINNGHSTTCPRPYRRRILDLLNKYV